MDRAVLERKIYSFDPAFGWCGNYRVYLIDMKVMFLDLADHILKVYCTYFFRLRQTKTVLLIKCVHLRQTIIECC